MPLARCDCHWRGICTCLHQVDPWAGDERYRRRICRGGARDRQSAVAHSYHPHSTQYFPGPSGSDCALYGHRDRRRSCVVVSRTKSAAARTILGKHVEFVLALAEQRAVDGILAGVSYSPGSAVVQSARRRLTRRP
jgi:hypothetical protein